MGFPPKVVPFEAVFIVILWKRSSDVDRIQGHLDGSFWLAQHLPERQPGGQAGQVGFSTNGRMYVNLGKPFQ